MQVGTTKDQGLYDKPSTAVHPGTLAAGTLPKYSNTWPVTNSSLRSPTLLITVSVYIILPLFLYSCKIWSFPPRFLKIGC